MKIDQIAFRGRFLNAFEASPYKSMRQLSIDSGFSESHIHKIFNGQYDNSNTGPGSFGLARAAYQMGKTPNYFLGFEEVRAPQMAEGPTISKMFKCYFESGARLEGFGEMIKFCDIFGMPKDGVTYLEKVGPLSLMSRTSKERDPIKLQMEFEKAEPELRKEIFDGQMRAWDAGALAEPFYMDRRMISRPLHVRLPFIRVGCRVSTMAGEEKLLIFCQGLNE